MEGVRVTNNLIQRDQNAHPKIQVKCGGVDHLRMIDLNFLKRGQNFKPFSRRRHRVMTSEDVPIEGLAMSSGYMESQTVMPSLGDH